MRTIWVNEAESFSYDSFVKFHGKFFRDPHDHIIYVSKSVLQCICLYNYMGESFQDYSRIQDFEADFP